MATKTKRKRAEAGKPLKAVMVTTSHRGVFFGYTPPPVKMDDTIVLHNARMCVYWSADMKGITGLASAGPSKTCKIGPAAPTLRLSGITAVFDVSDGAVKRWEDAPWG